MNEINVVSSIVDHAAVMVIAGGVLLFLLWGLLVVVKMVVGHVIAHYVTRKAVQKWGRPATRQPDEWKEDSDYDDTVGR